jgi:hypothetical protein
MVQKKMLLEPGSLNLVKAYAAKKPNTVTKTALVVETTNELIK